MEVKNGSDVTMASLSWDFVIQVKSCSHCSGPSCQYPKNAYTHLSLVQKFTKALIEQKLFIHEVQQAHIKILKFFVVIKYRDHTTFQNM